MPEIEWDMSQHPLFIASRTFLQNTFGSELSKKTLIDLGCLEGGFTAEFARLGMQAAGLEVRSSNFQNCEFVRKALKLPNPFHSGRLLERSEIWAFRCRLLFWTSLSSPRPREIFRLAVDAM